MDLPYIAGLTEAVGEVHPDHYAECVPGVTLNDPARISTVRRLGRTVSWSTVNCFQTGQNQSEMQKKKAELTHISNDLALSRAACSS